MKYVYGWYSSYGHVRDEIIEREKKNIFHVNTNKYGER